MSHRFAAAIIAFLVLSSQLSANTLPDEYVERMLEGLAARGCQALVTLAIPPAVPGPRPVAAEGKFTAFVRSLFSNSWEPMARRAARLEAISKFEKSEQEYVDYRNQLQRRRESFTKARWNTLGSFDYAPLKEAERRLIDHMEKLAQQAQTLEQLDQLEATYALYHQKIHAESQLIASEKKGLIATLEQKRNNKDLSLPLQRRVNSIVDEAIQILRNPVGLDQIYETEDRVLASITETEQGFIASEQTRKQQELRFDIKQKGNSKAILTALLGLDPKSQNLALSPENLLGLSQMMERKPNIKAFVYRELQVLRRILRIADQALNSDVRERLQKGISIRLANDVSSLLAYAPDRKLKPLDQLELLRKALVRLNDPQLSKRLAKGGLHQLGLLEREEIIQNALVSNELRYAILASTLDLKIAIPAPYRPVPRSASPPSKPKIPRGKISRSEYSRLLDEVERYKSKANAWNRSREEYIAAVKRFNNSDLKIYRSAQAQLRLAYQRRQAARNDLVTYLALTQPHSFKETQVPAHFVSAARGKVAASPAEDVSTPYGTNRSSLSATTTNSSDDFWFWMWWFNQNHPIPFLEKPEDLMTVVATDANVFGVNSDQKVDILATYGFNENSKSVNVPIELPFQEQSEIVGATPTAFGLDSNGSPESEVGIAIVPDDVISRYEAWPQVELPDMSTLEPPNMEIPMVEMPSLSDYEVNGLLSGVSVEDSRSSWGDSSSNESYDFGGGDSGGGSDGGGGGD